jgi:enterochelin esterase-like enzyme
MKHISKRMPRFSGNFNAAQRLKPAIPYFLTFFITLLAGALLFSSKITGGVVSFIVNAGLDPQRAQLVAALMLTTLSGGIGGMLGRRRWMAVMGGGIVFWLGYLAGFIQLEQQPTYDPGGHLEGLDVAALAHTSFILAALGLLSAFIGAAIGIALGEVLFDPFVRLVKLGWQRVRYIRKRQLPRPLATGSTPLFRSADIGPWSGVVLMVVLIILASSAGEVILYAPDANLHTAPAISSPHGKVAAHSTIVTDSLISPALNGQRRNFQVYLPPSYNTPQGRTKRYPTLYLLHGSPGGDSDWFNAGKANQSADTLIATAKIPELLIITPDGNGRSGETSEWGNSFDRKQLIETFVSVDLVNYVDQKYRTMPAPAYRAIGGNSMGAFGAMNIALHHPDVFGSVISLGGYYVAEGGIWGSNAAYIRANSPADYISTDKQAWTLHLFIGSATKDQPYYTYALNFVKEINKLPIKYNVDIQNGYHSWKIWQIQIYIALLWLR